MAIKTYNDFTIQAIDRLGPEDRREIVIRDVQWEGAQQTEEISQPIPDALWKSITKLDRRELSCAQIVELGEVLAALLFPGDVRELFMQSLMKITDEVGLRLRLQLSPYLSALPWEYLYLHSGKSEKTEADFLVFNPKISIVRHQATGSPANFDDKPKQRRLLLVTADPEATAQSRLSLQREFEEMQAALADISGLTIDPLTDATIQHFGDRLLQEPDIVHFAGHGVYDRTGLRAEKFTSAGHGDIIFDTGDNQCEPMRAEDFALRLHNRGIQLVVLCACESAKRDPESTWSSVATALMEKDIPAVVAMQFQIEDKNALAFSRQFYKALSLGHPLDAAVAEGRQAICDTCNGYRGNSELEKYWRDWGAPVLYERSGKVLTLPMIVDSAHNGHTPVHPLHRRKRLSAEQIERLHQEDVAQRCETIAFALDTLVDAVQHSNEIKGQITEAAPVIRRLNRRIKELGVLKQVHDHLDRLEKKFNPILLYSESPARPWGEITAMLEDTGAVSIQAIIDDILRDSKDASTSEDIDIHERVYRVWNQLRNSVSRPVRNEHSFDRAIEEFGRLFQDIPASLSREMFSRLDALSESFDSLSRILQMSVNINTSMNANEFRKGIAVLSELGTDLETIVLCHSEMQFLDKELRPIRSSRALVPNRSNWKKIHRKVVKVRDKCDCEAWADTLSLRGDGIDAVYGGEDEEDEARMPTREEFEEFDRYFRTSFSDLDKRLLAFCNALDTTVRQPLQELGGPFQ